MDLMFGFCRIYAKYAIKFPVCGFYFPTQLSMDCYQQKRAKKGSVSSSVSDALYIVK